MYSFYHNFPSYLSTEDYNLIIKCKSCMNFILIFFCKEKKYYLLMMLERDANAEDEEKKWGTTKLKI